MSVVSMPLWAAHWTPPLRDPIVRARIAAVIRTARVSAFNGLQAEIAAVVIAAPVGGIALLGVRFGGTKTHVIVVCHTKEGEVTTSLL